MSTDISQKVEKKLKDAIIRVQKIIKTPEKKKPESKKK